MNKELLQSIYNRLLEIKESVSVDKNESICANLLLSIDKREITIRTWLYDQFNKWPECHVRWNGHKSIVFPVNGLIGFNKEIINETIWENPKRLRLLDFLIEQAEQQLNKI